MTAGRRDREDLARQSSQNSAGRSGSQPNEHPLTLATGGSRSARTPVPHYDYASDLWIDRRQHERELHFLLPDDGREGVNVPLGGGLFAHMSGLLTHNRPPASR
jgi:hypothetical protein